MKELIFVRLIKLPCSVRGFTAIDDDGNYNIYVNKCHNRETQRTTYKHEMRHILRGDIHSSKSIKSLEFD